MKIEFSRQIFEKCSNTKFHENPSSGSIVVPCRRTEGRTDRQTDMAKLTVAFRNFANVPKMTERREMINFRGNGRKKSWPNSRYFRRLCFGDLRKSAKNLSRDSVVGTLTIVQAERSVVRIPAGTKDLSLLQKPLPTSGPIKLPTEWVLLFLSKR
jgi:hypothetical protein